MITTEKGSNVINYNRWKELRDLGFEPKWIGVGYTLSKGAQAQRRREFEKQYQRESGIKINNDSCKG